MLVGVAVIAAHARELDALLLGELGAQSVGVDVPRVRLRVVLADARWSSAPRSPSPGRSASSGCWCRTSSGWRSARATARCCHWPSSAAVVFLLVADIVARTLSVREIPVGVVTAAIGAPTFLFLLMRRRTVGTVS